MRYLLLQPESAYTEAWCAAEHGGQVEVTLEGGTRADYVLEGRYAVEVERAHKYAEGIGQSLFYASQTGLEAGLVVIAGEGDERYLRRLGQVIEHYGLPIRVWIVEKD